MNAPEDEFDDFLRNRKPLFRASEEDVLEPPAELDRIVLRQAREAIEAPRPQRMYGAPRWTAPIAVAATLAVAFTVVLQFMPTHRAVPTRSAEISPQPAARRIDMPAEAPAMAANDATADAHASSSGAVIVQLDPSAAERAAGSPAPESRIEGPTASPELAKQHAKPDEMAPPVGGRARVAARASDAPAPAHAPEYRRDEKAWLAEIERLRVAGDVTLADAELAEFKRQHRAYASGPDR